MKMVMLSLLVFFTCLFTFLMMLPNVPAFVSVLVGFSGVLAVVAVVLAVEQGE
jgi:hypothetical protein